MTKKTKPMITSKREPHLDLYWWPSGNSKTIDPDAVFAAFVDSFSMEQATKRLWQMFKAAMAAEYEYEDPKDRAGLIFLYEKLHDLCMAVHIRAKENQVKLQTTIVSREVTTTSIGANEMGGEE